MSTAALSWLSALPGSWPKSTALPWSPSYSLSWLNSISCHQKWHKKWPEEKSLLKHEGFETRRGFSSPCLSLQPKWANSVLPGSWIFLQASRGVMIRMCPLAWYYLHGSALCHMRWLLFVSPPERWGVRHLWKSPSAEGSFLKLVETASNALGKSQLRCNNHLMFHWPRMVTLAVLLAICRDMVLCILPFWQAVLFFQDVFELETL